MIQKIALLLGLSLCSAILYRLGGTKVGTKWRDIGCSLVICLATGLIWGKFTPLKLLSLIPCFLAMWGALSTYRYFLPKPKDYSFIHYLLHGLFVSLAMFPYAWVSGHWLGFGIRCGVCAVLIGVWSHFVKWDVLEEGGRGFILCGSIPILLL